MHEPNNDLWYRLYGDNSAIGSVALVVYPLIFTAIGGTCFWLLR